MPRYKKVRRQADAARETRTRSRVARRGAPAPASQTLVGRDERPRPRGEFFAQVEKRPVSLSLSLSLSVRFERRRSGDFAHVRLRRLRRRVRARGAPRLPARADRLCGRRRRRREGEDAPPYDRATRGAAILHLPETFPQLSLSLSLSLCRTFRTCVLSTGPREIVRAFGVAFFGRCRACARRCCARSRHPRARERPNDSRSRFDEFSSCILIYIESG